MEDVQHYVTEKVKPTTALLTSVGETGLGAAESAIEQIPTVVSQAKAAAGLGLVMGATAAEFGLEAAESGMDRVAEASQRGMEAVGQAVEFGREKALQAAKSPYGQMAARGLDKAAVMADTLVGAHMPAEAARMARRGLMNGVP